MSWDKLDEVGGGGKGSSIFIALKDKENVEGVFRGKPHFYYAIYKQKEEYETKVKDSSLKFKVNFLVKENGQFTTKILNQGKLLAELIRTYINEYGEDTLFKIERQGSTKDDTHYFIYPKGPLSPEDLMKVKACRLQELKPKSTGSTAEDDIPNFKSEVPF